MTKLKKILASSVAIVSVNASAAIPTEASDALATFITDATAFVASFWPLLIGVTISFLFMKLFKKGTSKAT